MVSHGLPNNETEWRLQQATMKLEDLIIESKENESRLERSCKS